MKTLIYQYWDGDIRPGNLTGQKQMKKYADQIRSDYMYENNPNTYNNLGKYSIYYGAFKFIYDTSFDKYDYILYADTDIIPKNEINENIFDQFLFDNSLEFGICEELDQPEIRLKSISHINEKWAKLIQEKWNAKIFRNSNNLIRVFNSGVVLYSRNGITKCRNYFKNFKEYIDLVSQIGNFYPTDQPYLNAMMGVCDLKTIIMDNKWNSSVQFNADRSIKDLRTKDTNFVHVQLNGKHWFDEEKTLRIANLPVSEWNL